MSLRFLCCCATCAPVALFSLNTNCTTTNNPQHNHNTPKKPTKQENIRESNRAWWPIQLLNRWLSIRLEVTGASVVFVTALAVGVAVPVSAGLAGFALTSALSLTGTLAWFVRQTTELELAMNSGALRACVFCECV